MHRTTISELTLNGRLRRLSLWRNGSLWLALLAVGLTIWLALQASSLQHFLVSGLRVAFWIATIYWVVRIWRIVFSVRLGR